MAFLGTTDKGEEVEISKRAAESDLLIYVNINLVAMDGGHKSVATGLASYRSLRHHHNVDTMRQSRSFMDHHRSELHSSNWRMGQLITAKRREGVPDRDDAQHRHVPEVVRLPAEVPSGSGPRVIAPCSSEPSEVARPRTAEDGAFDLPVARSAVPR